MTDDSIVGHTHTIFQVPIVYTVDVRDELITAHTNLAAVSPILQHRRLAHLGHKRTKLAEKLGIVEPSDDQHEFCEACRLGKARQIISRANMPKATKVGGIIYVDVQHIKPTAHDGSNYATFILDDYLRMPEARFHINKDGASKALIDYCKEFHNSAGYWPVLIAKDLGREFNAFNNWAKNLGILLRHSPPRTKEPNGAIERLQFFIVQISRVMIIDAGLPPNLWPFAIDTAIYIHSRLPLVDRKEAPIQIWRRGLSLPNPTPYLEHLRVWGCKAYVYIPIENRVKAEKVKPKALIGRLVGYVGDHGHVYRIWYPDTGKTVVTRDVTFWEGDEDGTLDIVNDVQSMPKAGWGKPISIKVFDANTSSNRSERLLLTGEPSHEDIFTILGQDQETTFNYHENQYAQRRLVTLSPSPENLALDTPIESVESDHKPTSDIQDIQIHDSPPENNDKDLSPDQMQLLQETAATQLAEPQRLEPRRSSRSTKGQRSTASFEEEQTTQAEQERLHRAQKKVKFAIETKVNDDPNESTNPNALIAVAATGPTKRKWEVQIPTNHTQALKATEADLWFAAKTEQVKKLKDNKTWNLVEMPKDGIRILPVRTTSYSSTKPTSSERTYTRYLVAKGYLLGNLQVMKKDHGTIDSKLRDLGFLPLAEDPCIYFNKSRGIYILLYVDDTLIAAKDIDAIHWLLNELDAEYGVKRIGHPKKFLGCNLHYNPTSQVISMFQEPYVKEILNRFDMDRCSGRKAPIEPGSKLTFTGESPDPGFLEIYQKIVGSLNWLEFKTRPDICFAVRFLQWKQKEPIKDDMERTKGVLRYLRAHSNLGLTLNKDPKRGLQLFTDSSFADHPDGKSSQGWCLFWAGCPIAWDTAKQTCVAPSSTAAEYMCFGDGMKHALYAKRILVAFGLMKEDDKITLYMDSNNAMDALKKRSAPAVRWLANRYHFVRDILEKGEVVVERVDTDDNVADGFTKPKNPVKFAEFLKQLGLEPIDIKVDEE
ncbi:hypothetical protein TSTA_097620 [Talaromyces stipitatus ATCC 10500]|uniref:Integrase catalytic domain-containing protein n=1 Tax=Talaromyces stipitatus (strain ATCC 10500 / CBS 375.48 / QM 6759 / NRRL 1006) TaxID=441959 RepID=B8MLZ4_TALSN|nr:uncharacterized protein TSTA_097620 [Talaromyces stipitatus ATCC 10500]EED13506.1 hypothetical protein TSTA_097620 [Talaromyces stipitatus ATCC 10500]